MKKVTKSLFSWLLALCMILTAMPMTAYAAEGTVAIVKTVDEFKKAVSNSDIKTVELYENITIEKGFEITNNVVIDLKNHTLNLKTDEGPSLDFNSTKGITVKNGTIDITGSNATGDSIMGIGHPKDNVRDYSKLTFDNVHVNGNGYSSAYGVFYIYNGEMTVNGGSMTLTGDSHVSGGVFNTEKSSSKLTINNAKLDLTNVRRVAVIVDTTIKKSIVNIQGNENAGPEMDNAFNMTPLKIIDSEVTMKNLSGRGITAKDNSVEISGNSSVTMDNCGEGALMLRKDAKVEVKDSAKLDAETVVLDGVSQDNEMITIEPGAKFEAANVYAKGKGGLKEVEDTSKLISGNENNVRVGVVEVDGKVYTSLKAAAEAAKVGSVVTLINNIDISTTGVTFKTDVTLDLNGYELKAANRDSGNIKVTNGTLTLKDSEGTGKIYSKTPYNKADSTTTSVIKVIGEDSKLIVVQQIK